MTPDWLLWARRPGTSSGAQTRPGTPVEDVERGVLRQRGESARWGGDGEGTGDDATVDDGFGASAVAQKDVANEPHVPLGEAAMFVEEEPSASNVATNELEQDISEEPVPPYDQKQPTSPREDDIQETGVEAVEPERGREHEREARAVRFAAASE